MLRLHYASIENQEGIKISENKLMLDKDIWQKCRDILKQDDQEQDGIIHMIPINDSDGKLAAYGYQDNEANRELRMLRELRDNEKALQFRDVFPQYEEVVIYGCNELAVMFAEYLDEIGIKVSVAGEYWDVFERKSDIGLFLSGGAKTGYLCRGNSTSE